MLSTHHFTFLEFIDASGFTCTASSTYNHSFGCQNVYDGTGNSWFTKVGEGQDAWIKVNLHQQVNLARIDIKQTTYGRYKELELTFSNGLSAIARCTERILDRGWCNITLSTPVKTTFIKIDALDRLVNNLVQYGFEEMRLPANIGTLIAK